MSDNLEKLIEAAAAKGELTHLSLVPSHTKTTVWRASYASASGFGYVHAEAATPVAALKEALTRKPAKAKKSTNEKEDLDFG